MFEVVFNYNYFKNFEVFLLYIMIKIVTLAAENIQLVKKWNENLIFIIF